MLTLIAAAAVALCQPPVPPEAPPGPEAQVSRERVMANLESLPKARAARGDIQSQKGLAATEELLVARLKEMGYEPTLEPLSWNLSKQAETEARLRKEAEKSTPAEPAKGADEPSSPPLVESKLAPEMTPELAGRTWHNVVVEIPGTELPKEVVVVSAHFDAVAGAPGADDDGSGVAALLEAA